MKTRCYDKETIETKVQSDDRWLARAVLAIWRFQTMDERRQERTSHNNGVGFTAADGSFLTSLGNQLNRGWSLSNRQKFVARKKMKKYTGQLLRICELNGYEVDSKKART